MWLRISISFFKIIYFATKRFKWEAMFDQRLEQLQIWLKYKGTVSPLSPGLNSLPTNG